MGKSKPKQEVNLYYMSIHFGICAEADALRRIVIKEKEAWSGYATTQTTITINKPELFGGNKKEGGAAGTVHWLPGPVTQILPDELATRLGRADGADAPGYRGIASAFFVGGTAGSGGGVGGLEGLFSTLLKAGSGAGFYWSANQPYLPGTWITVQRAPKGLDPAIALISRLGTNYFPYETHPSSISASDGFTNVAGSVFARFRQTVVEWWDLDSLEQVGFTSSASDTFFGTIWNWALANDGTAYAIGQYADGLSVFSALYACPPGGPSTKAVEFSSSPWFSGPTRVFDLASGLKVLTAVPTGSPGYVDYGDFVPGAETVRDFCVDTNDVIWKLSQPDSSSADFTIATLDNGTSFVITGLVTRGAPSNPTFCHVPDHSQFFVVSDGKWYTIDDATGAIKGSGAFGFPTLNLPRSFPGRNAYWADFTEISLEDASTIRSVDPDDWVAEGTVGDDLYDPINNAIWTDRTSHLAVRFLDRGEVDANPAHIIYECLTNTDWGMGSPSTLIDLDSFNDAAQTLFDEPLGLSMIWTRQAAVQDFIQEVLDHIQAVLFVDPQTGLLTLKLIRGDYDLGDLTTIDPSTATLTNFGRKLWGEIVNEISVTWTNPDNEQDETVTVHDLASITTQGGIVSDSRNYYGVRSATVAARLAARDLRSAGAPLATCEAEVDRSQWTLRPASVLLLDWPEYGLDGLVMRVTAIDYGKPGDPTIKLSLIEDVFGLDAGAYIEPPTSSWEDPSSAPAPLEHEAVFTMPLYFAANSTVAAFVDSPEYPEVIAGVLGTTSNADTFSWELWDEVPLPDGTPEWTNLQTNNVIGYAELLTAIDVEAETTLAAADFDTAMGQTGPSTGGFVLIGDGSEATSEIALIIAAGTSFTVSRGVLDTVPRAWPIGTPVWFLDAASLFEDPLIRSAFEEVSYKFRTRTSRGLLSLSATPLTEYTLTERPWLPNRPADVKAYGVAFSSSTDAIDAIARPDPWVTVTWAERNRLTEDAQVLAWTDATTAPETDQTTTITVLAPDETPITSHSGLTGTSFDVPDASFGSEPVVILRTSSERTDADGTFGSLQAFDHWVTVGFAGGTEAVSGAGAFSGVGAAVRSGALSSSGAGAMSGSGVANNAGALSGSGVGALSGAAGGPPILVTLGADNDATITLSGGSLIATKNGTTGAAYAFATEGKEAGKFYFEVTVNALTTQEVNIGVSGGLFLSQRANFLGISQSTGIAINSNGAGVIYGTTQYAATFVAGDVIGIFVDATNNIVWFSKNGTVLNGSPSAGTGGTSVASLNKAWYPTAYLHGANSQVTFNFGATAFANAPPASFQAWNASSPQTNFAAFRSSVMWIRSLGFFSHAMAEFELMATSGGANVLSGATVTSSASITSGALANLVDASTSTYVAVGSGAVQNQVNAYFAFELGASATRNVTFAAVRGRDGGGGGEQQAPRLFDLWLSTGTVAGGIWYRAKTAAALSAFAATTPGERKEFAVP